MTQYQQIDFNLAQDLKCVRQTSTPGDILLMKAERSSRFVCHWGRYGVSCWCCTWCRSKIKWTRLRIRHCDTQNLMDDICLFVNWHASGNSRIKSLDGGPADAPWQRKYARTLKSTLCSMLPNTSYVSRRVCRRQQTVRLPHISRGEDCMHIG